MLQRSRERQVGFGQTVLWDPNTEWPPGEIPFSRIRKLGSGGMGSVFLVQDELGRQYALKTLRDEVASIDKVVNRFKRELEIAITLDHPNVVRTYNAFETTEGNLYMLSEYCPHGTAAHWLQANGPLSSELAVNWMKEAARALEYVWKEHGLIHRDIKPDNLLLNERDNIKIADFGVAVNRVRDANQLLPSRLNLVFDPFFK